MSDAAHRQELEAAQAEAAALKRTLAERPPFPPEQPQLETRIRSANTELGTFEHRLATLARDEVLARNALDLQRGAALAWWQSPLALPLVMLAAVGAIWLAYRSLDYISWPLWSRRLQVVFLAAPLGVNLLRIALISVRDARRRFREGRS